MNQVQYSDNTLTLRGRLVFDTVMSVLNEGMAFFKETSSLTVDLTQVEHADSAALALLFEWLRQAKKRNIELTFKNPPKQLRNIARISQVDTLLNL